MRAQRGPLVRAAIDVRGVLEPCITFTPAAGRWPEHETADRMVLCAGLAALTLEHVEAAGDETVANYIRTAANLLARGAPARGAMSELVRRPAGARNAAAPRPVRLELRRSVLGAVPRLKGSRHGPGTLLHAALAIVSTTFDDARDDERLAMALVLEGVLAWQDKAGIRSAQQAVAYATHHAAARLHESGRSIPGALADTIATQRRLAPIAGGS